jgi:hypothetical protein
MRDESPIQWLRITYASRFKVQARGGGPRGVCWRVGPKRKSVCVTAAGATSSPTVAVPASAGNVGSGAGPAL